MATHHDEAKAGNVHTDGDHVRREKDVDRRLPDRLHTPRDFELLQNFRNLFGAPAAGEFDDLANVPPAFVWNIAAMSLRSAVLVEVFGLPCLLLPT
jgi:hypothetical protein